MDWIEDAVAKAVRKARETARVVTDFPHITERGQWQFTPDGVWTGGFWAGILWLASEQDRDDDLKQRAVEMTDRLLPRASDTHNHDLGFMFYPSAIKAWRVTGDEKYRRVAMDAASALARQFNEEAGFIPGWGFFGGEAWGGSVLIDTMMNLPLLVWAVQQGADASLMQVVERHAAKTLQYHLRADGSVYHVYKFDPRTGAALHGDTYQGLNAESSWVRGHGWAITGSAILAAMTGDKRYQAASEKVAQYFSNQWQPGTVPPWDFKAAGGHEPPDASAGAIVSYGLQRLYSETKKQAYLDTAVDLLKVLAQECGNEAEQGGLLLHATADLPHGLGIDQSTAYGDYYYLKSLLLLRRHLHR